MQQFISTFLMLCWAIMATAQHSTTLLNEPLDLSKDFRDFTNTYFLADSLAAFDPATRQGQLKWRRNEYYPAHAFNNTQAGLRKIQGNEFPGIEYAVDPVLQDPQRIYSK